MLAAYFVWFPHVFVLFKFALLVRYRLFLLEDLGLFCALLDAAILMLGSPSLP